GIGVNGVVRADFEVSALVGLRHDCYLSASLRARAVASFHAIQPRSAHLIRAGYLATPANTTASPSTSSSGSEATESPAPCIRSTNAALISIASLTGLPITRSVSTDTLAWLIEQPSASYDTSATAGSVPASLSVTRSVTSSPQVGLTWCTSAWNGSCCPLGGRAPYGINILSCGYCTKCRRQLEESSVPPYVL